MSKTPEKPHERPKETQKETQTPPVKPPEKPKEQPLGAPAAKREPIKPLEDAYLRVAAEKTSGVKILLEEPDGSRSEHFVAPEDEHAPFVTIDGVSCHHVSDVAHTWVYRRS